MSSTLSGFAKSIISVYQTFRNKETGVNIMVNNVEQMILASSQFEVVTFITRGIFNLITRAKFVSGTVFPVWTPSIAHEEF